MIQNPGNSFTLLSLVYVILLAAVYFTKPRAKNLETKIYNYIVITCLIGNTLSLGTYYFMMHYIKYPLLNEIFARAYLLFVLSFVSLISYYVLIISLGEKYSEQKRNKYLKYCKTMILVFTMIAFFLSIVLPIEYVSETNIIYSTGPAVKFVFTSTRIYALMWIIVLLIKIKRIKEKKYWPMILYIILGGAISYIQGNHPEYLLSTSMMIFVTFLMYFTIENPDVKIMRQLELAKDTAEKANRAKSDFLSSMSHEIRTPLNAIKGFSGCIGSAETLEEAKENANDIVMASDTLLEIVNGILDISKIEANKMELVEGEYNVPEMLKNLINMTKIKIGEKDIELRSDFAEDLPSLLYGDKGKVQQVILNLLTNAAKYTEKGYIDFNISCVNEKEKCKLVISVKDTGRGIKKEQIDKLFTKFNRLESDKNTTLEGTGLGLAITKNLVEMMGGKIVVDSTYGEGSKFTIFLTQKIIDKIKIEVEKQADEQVEFPNKRILVVDDNFLNLKIACKLLKDRKIDTEQVQSGQECIEKIKSGNKYDIIFMDIMMPKLSGVETLKILKDIEGFNIPIVALTADAMSGVSNKYIEVGFNDYLSKPIENTELNRVLNKFLVEGIKSIEIKNKALIVNTKDDESKDIINDALDKIHVIGEYCLSEECIERIKNDNYKVIIIEDLDFTKSQNLLNSIKRIKNFNIPVIVLSDTSTYLKREDYKRMGFDDYIAKPIADKVFQKVIKHNIESKNEDGNVNNT